jgi:Holliday junction resolvase RusA-like endonuclease
VTVDPPYPPVIKILRGGKANRECRTLIYTLPYPPSANSHWIVARNRIILSSKARLYRQAVSVALNEQGRPVLPLSGPVRVEVLVYCSDARKRDLDNIPKETADALQRNGVLKDDFLIDEWFLKRMPVDRINPRLEVMVIPL